MQPTVYIMTNHTNKVLYIGVTSKPIQRTWQHKKKLIEGFSKKYKLYKLVYYENHDAMWTAISREKQLKKWSRKKKDSLINKMNPDWKDLYVDICN